MVRESVLFIGTQFSILYTVRSGPGVARTILLFHTISARPLKASYGTYLP